MSRHLEVGQAGEDRAAQFYAERGCRVVERNYRKPFGEIDLIVLDGDELVFAEVKTRTTDVFGGGEGAISASKRRRIERAAECYLSEMAFEFAGVRFDVVAINGDQLVHLEDAWEAGSG